MKEKKRVTIYDIALELEVSPSTVSRALKDHYSIGKEMIAMVKKHAQKRGYRPNSIAASLRRSKTNTIGIITSWINRPFVSSLISGVEEEAARVGYNVIISQSHDSFDNEVASAKALYDSRVDGIIVSLAMETIHYDHFQQFTDNDTPIVFVDRVPDEYKADLVVIDNYTAGFAATEHLILQGCTRIAHFAGAQQRNIYRERCNGYLAALNKYGIPADESLIVRGASLSAEEGMKMANYVLSLSEPPDGIFSPNDTAAVSAIQCAKSKGLKIPEDLAVIGFNNDPVGLIVEPNLSSVTHPAINMGRIAALQVLKHLKSNDGVAPEVITLKTELIARESSLRRKL